METQASGEFSGWVRRGREATRYRENTPEKQYLLVDGYNIIFAWEDLQELAKANIDGARTKLMDILCNYQGYKRCTVILVFDAYKVQGNPGKTEKYHNIHVVYTKEAETADQYIEKTVHEIGKKYHVTVATSDRLEQVIILGQGGAGCLLGNCERRSIWSWGRSGRRRRIAGKVEKIIFSTGWMRRPRDIWKMSDWGEKKNRRGIQP